MKRIIYALFFFCMNFNVQAQDTFSILAFDSITREVGAAGASCVDLYPSPYSNDFICELFPDTGAIACQAAYIPNNQANARYRMRVGNDPQQIIAYVTGIDAQSASRQYGVIKMDSTPVRAAAFTGTNCQNYKNHIVGPNYTIHGNILLGQQVLDSMEARFLRAEGDLACKLMAAMQGANMIGADTRCAPNNSSSLFAFLKVSMPTDTFGKPSFLVSLRTKNGDNIEPIDSLQKLFSAARSCTFNTAGINQLNASFGTLMAGQDILRQMLSVSGANLNGAFVKLTDAAGRLVYEQQEQANTVSISTLGWAKGVYLLTVKSENGTQRKKLVIQ